MPLNETQKQPAQPPLFGLLWWHEVPFLGLVSWAFYLAQNLRWSPWAINCFGLAIVAGMAVVAWRSLDEWRVLPNRTFFFLLAGGWTVLFIFLGNSTFGYIASTSIFWWAYDIFTAPDADGLNLMVPFAVLALFWWKRKELVARPLGLWSPALWIFVAGLGMHLLGYVVQQPRLSFLGFITGLYGLTGLAWGKNWLKASFFPFFLLLFCVPGGGTDWLTLRMRLMVSWIVAGIAHLGLAPDLIRDGTQLLDGQHTFGFEVAAACSGIRSLTALLALTTVYGFVAFKSPWQRAAMIASAFPLAILCNVARLCFTIMVSELAGQSAGKSVESNAGFITFASALVCIYFLSRWLERFEKSGPESTPTAATPAPVTAAAGDRALPVLGGVVLALMVSSVLLLHHMKSGQRLGEPGVKTRPIAGSQRLEVVLPETVPGYTSEIVTNAETPLERQLPPDSSFRSRLYMAGDKSQIQMTAVLMGTDRSSIHSPYICLTGQGWDIDNKHTLVESIRMERPLAYDLPVNKMIATKEFTGSDGKKEMVSGVYVYWYVDANHITANDKLWMGWWLPRDLLLHGLLERWSYISVFSPCLPGEEDATYERMKKLIATVLPEFQLVPKVGG